MLHDVCNILTAPLHEINFAALPVDPRISLSSIALEKSNHFKCQESMVSAE